ncbi:Bug family tripartite tricarboxylate transporter substrate binding protein [Hydrogenophaga sp.]|uniref:Bug family tripartite tricarboxylate transporter substrate binding protein n=1 Tax=Hydrogenophaga sp. TaxID=1904254 RepID=UPI002FC66908
MKSLKPFAPTRTTRRQLLRGAATAACAICLLPAAQAQVDKWPTRSVTIVSPYNPGGTNDVVARLVADRLQKALGQPFVVENKPGAAGIVGSGGVMRAAPDGYTLLSGNNGSMVVQSVVKKPSPYDPATAFTPVAKVADAPNYIAISSTVPADTVGEFIAYTKRNPGKLNYSSAGSGSFGNFMGEYFKQQTGTYIVHIPGRGSASALNEMVAGRIELMIDPLVLNQRNGGRIKVLATTHASRVDAYPDIPTIKESGGPELDITGWFGLFGPANLPREVVDKINGVLQGMASDPEARKMLATAGLVPAHLPGAAFSNLIKEDVKRYDAIQQRARIVVE